MSDKIYVNFGISITQGVKNDDRYEVLHTITISDGTRTEIIGSAKTEKEANAIYSAVIAGIEMVSTIECSCVEESSLIATEEVPTKKSKKADIKSE